MQENKCLQSELLASYGLPLALIFAIAVALLGALIGNSDLVIIGAVFGAALGYILKVHRHAVATERRILELLECEHDATEPLIARRLMQVATQEEVHSALMRLNEKGAIRCSEKYPGARITYTIAAAPYFIGAPE